MNFNKLFRETPFPLLSLTYIEIDNHFYSPECISFQYVLLTELDKNTLRVSHLWHTGLLGLWSAGISVGTLTAGGYCRGTLFLHFYSVDRGCLEKDQGRSLAAPSLF
jgi:hypothetical protein